MTGNKVALDTNVAVKVLNDAPMVLSFLRQFTDLYLPVTVLGELRFGALNSARSVENLRKVDGLLLRCTPLNADVAGADSYARVRAQLKSKGTPIPENDVWIAAICIQHGLALATEDQHFSRVSGLQTIHP